MTANDTEDGDHEFRAALLLAGGALDRARGGAEAEAAALDL